MASRFIYHMCDSEEWNAAQISGSYKGSSQDQKDGFIHFSSGPQLFASAAKHRSGQDNLILVEVDAQKLSSSLKWELSRNDEKFPHLYDDLPLSAVTRSFKLKLNKDGVHVFPNDWDFD